jgi:uncharacterized protein with PIN domain
MSEFTFYVGIDLGNTQQAICVLDGCRKQVLQRVADIDHAVLRVVEAVGDTPFEQVAVGVEDLNNVVVDGLLDLGFSVFSINPKQADRFRDRMSAAGAKDDRRDAQVLARALTTDLEFFHRRAPRTELEMAMRVSRRREASMAEEVRRLSSQLYALVQRLDPSLLRLCQGADERWFWSLVLAVLAKPKAPKAQHLETMLRKEGKRKLGELVPTVMAIVDDSKRTRANPKLTAIMLPEVRTTIAALRTLETERSKAMSDLTALVESERRRSDVLDDNREVPSVMAVALSMPGVGVKTAADLVADATHLLRRDRLMLLRAVTGVAPVTKRSGKSNQVIMRRACNIRLRNAMHHAAEVAARHDPAFKAYFNKLVAAGHGRARALRSVADKMLRILVAMMTDRTLYRGSGEHLVPSEEPSEQAPARCA